GGRRDDARPAVLHRHDRGTGGPRLRPAGRPVAAAKPGREAAPEPARHILRSVAMSIATTDPRPLKPPADRTAGADVAAAAAGTTRALGFRTNLAWTLLGNTAYAASQWAILILLAKLSTPEMVGQFALGLAITAPVFMLTNLQLRAVQATDARHEFPFGDYLVLRLITTVLAWLAVAGVVLIGGSRGETALVILAFALAKGIESLSDIIYGLLQQHERMDRIALSLMLKGLLTLGVLAAAITLTGRTLWATLGLCA